MGSDLTIDDATLYLLYTACAMYDFLKFAVLLACLPLASHRLSAQTIVPAAKQGVLQEYGDEAAVVVRDEVAKLKIDQPGVILAGSCCARPR